jgi:hypothetical protein
MDAKFIYIPEIHGFQDKPLKITFRVFWIPFSRKIFFPIFAVP